MITNDEKLIMPCETKQEHNSTEKISIGHHFIVNTCNTIVKPNAVHIIDIQETRSDRPYRISMLTYM